MFSGIDHLGLFIVAGLLLNLTPGPDVLYIVTHGLRSGWRAGAVAAVGITAGCFVHIAAAALGLSAVMAASGTAFVLLKWLGAAYLVYVGWGMLGLRLPGLGQRLAASSAVPNAIDSVAVRAYSERVAAELPLEKVFIQGFWTNALNPKVALFFLAFLPQFISPDAAHKSVAFLLLGLLFNINGLWVNLAYAAISAALAQRLAAGLGATSWFQAAVRWLERTAGAIFILLGLRLALSDNPVQTIDLPRTQP